jgi:hypothetical protein
VRPTEIATETEAATPLVIESGRATAIRQRFVW